MDVSTSLPNDPKVRRLARESPDQLGTAFLAYVATVAESWHAGERLTIEDAWPSYLAFDEPTVAALKSVRLLDDGGRVPVKAWRGWFAPASKRRESGRKRWHDWKERQATKPGKSNGTAHGEQTVSEPFANHVPTGNRPTDRPNQDSTPPAPSPARGRRKPADPPGMTGNVTDYDAMVKSDDDLSPDWMADK